MAAASKNQAMAEAAIAATSKKPRRVRTGCLTCRERHLKCDETPGDCLNCRKSQRECRRGVRLNFIDTKVDQIPEVAFVPPQERSRGFVDESREIASEYVGGVEAYGSKHAQQPQIQQPQPHVHERQQMAPQQAYDNVYNQAQAQAQNQQMDTSYDYHQANAMNAPVMQPQQLPQGHGSMHTGQPDPYAQQQQQQQQQQQSQQYHYQQQQQQQHPQQLQQPLPQQRGMSFDTEQQQMKVEYEPMALLNSSSSSSASAVAHPHPAFHQSHTSMEEEEQAEIRDVLNTAEETLFMQVFVEEVGLWMDSMDPMKHFSKLLPFHALTQPMLMNAFLACGVRHLTLVNPAAYSEEKALAYYDKASRYLLRALQNPERDSVICATTAVILNVYEIMTEKAMPRMNHIAGARALIKECGWNARSGGIGAACFWLNVGMELLSNLHFNWQASWHPDQWGLELDLSQETEMCKEEVWTHKIVYITAKIGDFRATIPKTTDASPHNESIRRRKRTEDWELLRGLCDTWNANIPRTMQPMAYLYPYQTTSGSSFPEIWLIKRSTIVARLLYHTAMCLLAQVHPMKSKEVEDMHTMEQFHAHQICGIVAHVKDRGVASVALRSLAIAAECLTVRKEQEEVLQLFIRIHRETGWRIGFIPKDLAHSWGWDREPDFKLPTQDDPRAGLEGFGNPNGGAMQGSKYAVHQFDKYGEMQARREQARNSISSSHAGDMSSTVSTKFQQISPLTTAGGAGTSARGSVASTLTPPRKAPPQGIVNPMFAMADFSAAKHPYQEYYVAPAHHQAQSQPGHIMSNTGNYGHHMGAGYGQNSGGEDYGQYPGHSQQQNQVYGSSGGGGLGLHVPMQTQAAQMTGAYAPYLPLPDPSRMGPSGYSGPPPKQGQSGAGAGPGSSQGRY